MPKHIKQENMVEGPQSPKQTYPAKVDLRKSPANRPIGGTKKIIKVSQPPPSLRPSFRPHC